MKKYPAVLLISSIVIMGFVTDKQISKKLTSDVQAEWMPPDFKMDSDLLLIQYDKAYPGQCKKMKEFMASNYPHKYEFATHREMKSSDKYKDVSKYRFVLQRFFASIPSPDSKYNFTYFHFDFLDRHTKKEYKFCCENYSTNLSKALVVVIDKILEIQ